MNEETIWAEKYRPKTIDDCILPDTVKNKFKTFIEDGSIPNLLLFGTSGVGKSTIARALLDELDCDYMTINASLHRNIDTIRNDILEFASSNSMKNSNRKWILLEEADYLNITSSQPALRQLMDDYSEGCGFIFTLNNKSKMHPALISRCASIDFNFPKDVENTLKKQYALRCRDILTKENVKFDANNLLFVVKKYFPDFRGILNELQANVVDGKLSDDVLANTANESIDEFLDLLQSKDFTKLRHWCSKNSSIDTNNFVENIYNSNRIKPDSRPFLTLHAQDYLYKDNFVTLKEINTMAFITNLLADVEIVK